MKIENATIIRKAARELSTCCTGLAMCGYQHNDYLQLLRDEIEEFRILFAEWVKTFDQWDYIIDRWGLFNPPGIDYDAHDPDDDIPFDTNDFSDFLAHKLTNALYKYYRPIKKLLTTSRSPITQTIELRRTI